MRQIAPRHVKDYCYQDLNDSTFSYLKEKYEDEYTFIYKVKCMCGCNQFKIYMDKHPSAYLECSYCSKFITVYDLQYYPAAVKLDKEYTSEVYNMGNNFSVYVIYEYTDEFEIDDDVVFNPDDISWGKVYVKNKNTLKKILDDETA